MLLSLSLLGLQAILCGLLCAITNLAFLLFLMVCQTSTTIPVPTAALTPKTLTPMLSLCAATKGRRRARDEGSGRGLSTKVPVLMYGLLNSRGKKCCMCYICAGFDGCQRPPDDCTLQHMQQEPSQVMLSVLDVTNSRNDFVTCCNEVVHLFLHHIDLNLCMASCSGDRVSKTIS